MIWIPVLLSVFSLYLSIRNWWVFKHQTKLNRFEGNEHVIKQYLDYDAMMWKFWIWDIEKLRKKAK
jgi:hypothetical protein